jgi:hypothetical protein
MFLGEPCSAVGLDFLCFMVTMTTKFTVGNTGSHSDQVGLECLCVMVTKLFIFGQ